MKYLIFIFLLALVFSCKEELNIPKPSTYFRPDLPTASYRTYDSVVPYRFELSNLYSIKPVLWQGKPSPHLEMRLGTLNGSCYLTYYPVPNRDSLVRYINLANDKIDEHQIRASKIANERYLFPDKKVYCTLFEFQGDAATNFQFYITDSSSHFLRAEVLMNSRPNYDSLRPTLNYIKTDLIRFIKTFKWK